MIITEVKLHVLKNDITARVLGQGEMKDIGVPPTALIRVITDTGIEGNFISHLIEQGYAEQGIPVARKVLIGQDPQYIEAINQRLFSLFPHQVNSPILAGVNICLWDICAKAAKLPLYKYIGAYRDRIKAYASTVSCDSIEEYLAVTQQCVNEGFSAVKFHPFGDATRDIELCRAMRDAFPDIDLMLDPTSAYNRAEALKVGLVLDELNFYWYENPISDYDIEGLAMLQQKLKTPLAVAELSFPAFPAIHNYLRRDLGFFVRSLPENIGGLTQLLKTAHACEAFHVNYEVHSFGTSLLEAYCLHAALAIKNCDFIELLVPQGLLSQGMKEHIRVDKDGYVYAPTKPGLGYEIDWEEIDRITIAVH